MMPEHGLLFVRGRLAGFLNLPHSVAAACFCFFLALPLCALGQGVQAIRGIATESEASTAIARDSLVIEIAMRRERYAEILASSLATRNDPQASLLLHDAENAADRVLAARNDPKRLARELSDFTTAEKRLYAMPNRDIASEAFGRGGGFVGPLDIPVPQVHTLVPNVVFVVGFDVARLRSPERGTVTSLGVTTNLLGAAIGSTFDALGSGGLKEYFTNNISIGPAVPTKGRHKISSQLGVGLGGVNFGALTFWPSINLDQLDTSDLRVPLEVVAEKPSEQSWSRPGFGVAIPLGGAATLVQRIQAGKLVPIVTISYTAPFYFPGDNFSALAALFSTRRNDYVRRGLGTLAFGVSIPLLKVQPPPTTTP